MKRSVLIAMLSLSLVSLAISVSGGCGRASEKAHTSPQNRAAEESLRQQKKGD
jgi:hypothetical protein